MEHKLNTQLHPESISSANVANYYMATKQQYMQEAYGTPTCEGTANMCDVMMGYNLLKIMEVDHGPLCSRVETTIDQNRDAIDPSTDEGKRFAKLGLLTQYNNGIERTKNVYHFTNIVNADKQYRHIFKSIQATLIEEQTRRCKRKLLADIVTAQLLSLYDSGEVDKAVVDEYAKSFFEDIDEDEDEDHQMDVKMDVQSE